MRHSIFREERIEMNKPTITKTQAKEFYRDLCGTVYGDANKNSQGIMNIPMIAQHMEISTDKAEEFCNAMIKYGITDIRTLFENNVKFLKQFNRR
jgi:hypothetical protein